MFVSRLHRLENPVQCWMDMARTRTHILDLFLIFGEGFNLQHQIRCWLCIWVDELFIWLRKFPYILFRVFIMKKCRVLSLFFPAFVEMASWFLSFVTVMYSVKWFFKLFIYYLFLAASGCSFGSGPGVVVGWISCGTWDLGSPTRGQTHVPCIRRQTHDPWTPRQVPWADIWCWATLHSRAESLLVLIAVLCVARLDSVIVKGYYQSVFMVVGL